jgi:hypothetical protein
LHNLLALVLSEAALYALNTPRRSSLIAVAAATIALAVISVNLARFAAVPRCLDSFPRILQPDPSLQPLCGKLDVLHAPALITS